MIEFVSPTDPRFAATLAAQRPQLLAAAARKAYRFHGTSTCPTIQAAICLAADVTAGITRRELADHMGVV